MDIAINQQAAEVLTSQFQNLHTWIASESKWFLKNVMLPSS